MFGYVQVKTNELVELSQNEVGIILGKHHFHDSGVGTFGGIVNPGWRGHLTIEMNIFGEFDVQKNEKIAHVVIFTQ